jgi:hypothetical protein
MVSLISIKINIIYRNFKNMSKELYTVLVNDEGILENPVASKFLETNNLITKDNVSGGIRRYYWWL